MARTRASAPAPASLPPAPIEEPKKATRRAGKSTPEPAHEEHGTKDIRASLDALDQQGNWENTEEKSFGDVPDDKYQVQVDDTTINNAKSSGRLQVTWAVSIVSGPYKGRKLWFHDGIDDDDQRGYFKARLARIGLEWPKSAKDLPDTLEEAKEMFVFVTVKNKDGFTNVYFNKALDSADIDDAVTVEATTEASPAKEEGPTEASATFDDEKLTPVQRKAIKKIALTRDIDPDDYNALTDLMLDVGEGLGIFGEFDDPAVLMAEIEAAIKPA